MKSFGIIIFTLLIFNFAYAQHYARLGISTNEEIPEGLKQGEKAPHFVGLNQHGDTISLSKTLINQPVVLIFYRGYWCPACNAYLSDYQDSLQFIREAGAEIIAITPETIDGIGKTTALTDAAFDIISDTNMSIMQSYEVDFKVTATYATLTKLFAGASIAGNNQQEEAYLPIPATYLIGQNGEIIHVWFDPDYSERARISDILNFLKK